MCRLSPRIRLVPVAAAASLFAHPFARAFAQCAMCRESLEGDPAAQEGMRSGIFWTIVLFLGVFFSLVGGIVFLAARAGPTPSSQG